MEIIQKNTRKRLFMFTPSQNIPYKTDIKEIVISLNEMIEEQWNNEETENNQEIPIYKLHFSLDSNVHQHAVIKMQPKKHHQYHHDNGENKHFKRPNDSYDFVLNLKKQMEFIKMAYEELEMSHESAVDKYVIFTTTEEKKLTDTVLNLARVKPHETSSPSVKAAWDEINKAYLANKEFYETKKHLLHENIIVSQKKLLSLQDLQELLKQFRKLHTRVIGIGATQEKLNQLKFDDMQEKLLQYWQDIRMANTKIKDLN